MYVIENDNGEVLDGIYYDFTNDVDRALLFDEPIEPAEYAKLYGGHVIELVEKPKPVEVSEEEAEMLKKAKNTTVWRPASVIERYACEHERQADDEVLLEVRLMRAYVIGWVVEKPKRYVLPMEGTKLADGTIAYATLDHTGVWTIKGYAEKQSAVTLHATVTQSDIDTAPDWVKAIEKVEVTDDGIR